MIRALRIIVDAALTANADAHISGGAEM